MERSPLPLYLLLSKCSHPLDRLRWQLVRESLGQEPSWLRRAAKLLFAAGWPLVAVGRAISTTYKNRTELSRVLKRSPWRIVIDQWLSATWYSLPPAAFMVNARTIAQVPDARRQIVTNQERAYIVNVLNEGLPKNDLADKFLFFERCEKVGLPAIPVVYRFHRGQSQPGSSLPVPQDATYHGLFAKPAINEQGIGALAWTPVGDGNFRRSTGEIQSLQQIMDELQRRSEKGPDYLLQPRALNHESIRDLAGEALSTVRLLTARSPSGEIALLLAYFRMARGHNPIDNFAAGGLAAAVDLTSGTLGSAIAKRRPLSSTIVHPDSGGAISGRKLPWWPEARQLSATAHEQFAEFFLVGWDIALTDSGPVLVEGNEHPTVALQDQPLGLTPFPRIASEWLALHRSRHDV